MTKKILKNHLSLINLQKGYTEEDLKKILLLIKENIIKDLEKEVSSLEQFLTIINILDKHMNI